MTQPTTLEQSLNELLENYDDDNACICYKDCAHPKDKTQAKQELLSLFEKYGMETIPTRRAVSTKLYYSKQMLHKQSVDAGFNQAVAEQTTRLKQIPSSVKKDD